MLAASGLASRRAAEAWIRAGRVTVNGAPAHLGQRVDPARDRVALDGRILEPRPLRYWVLHKPRGVLTTRRDPFGRPAVLDLLPAAAQDLVPVGRLDRDSEGLLLLTNDGELAQVLLHPSFESEKEYHVTVRGRVSEGACRRLEAGVELRDGRTAPARVASLRYRARPDVTELRLILHEGRKRQIRRSLGALGYPVVSLVRIRIGTLRLGGLASGAARPLSRAEVAALRRYADRRRTARPPAGDSKGKGAGSGRRYPRRSARESGS